MEQIKILFYLLTSFFAFEKGHIAADKTTVTVHPDKQEIVIVQEGLFTVIQSEKDSTLVLEQWDNIFHWKENNTSWAKDLDSFSVKSFELTDTQNTIKPNIILKYSDEESLRALGIWYNPEKNQYSINHIPEHNLKTKVGELNGNYWNFEGGNAFSFTLEPFLQMPERYQKSKVPLNELLGK